MADDIFDKKKIIEALRAQGVPDKDIEKLYGAIPKPTKPQPTVNSAKINAHQKENAWKYDNKHKRPVREEDLDPDYEPIEELRKKTAKPKPRISKKKAPKKPKPVKNDWNSSSEARLKALYEAGYSTKEMATEFKTTEDAITGKLTRLRKAGWKGSIGTTHNPIPSPAGTTPQAANRKLSPEMKRFLANALEVNFGAVGRFFGKKWGLYEDKTRMGKGGSSADVTAAVIKSNEMVISALTKLDTAMRRGTSTLTKSIALSTSKMTDAINNVVELIKKNQNADAINTPNPTGKPGAGGSNGSGAAGIIAALLGGAGLSMLLNSRSEANVNPSDTIEPTSENDLREQGAPKASEQTPDIEIKVKELNFEAEDITFEADEFKFANKSGQATSKPNATNNKSTPSAPSSGSLNNMMDALKGGPGGAGFFNGLADKLIGGRGGAGGDNSSDASSNGGGGSGGGGSGGGGSGSGGIPSDKEIDDKDKSWWNGGKRSGGSKPNSGPTGGSSGGSGAGSDTGGVPSGTLAEQRSPYMDQMKKDPALEEKMMALMSAEEGDDSKARKMLAESAMNRGASRGNSSLDKILDPKYYAPMQNGSYENHLAKIRNNPAYRDQLKKELDEVGAGSNHSNYATDNGSAEVKQNAINRGDTVAATGDNGEAFIRKDKNPGYHGADVVAKTKSWYEDTKAADSLAANNNKPDANQGPTITIKPNVFSKGTDAVPYADDKSAVGGSDISDNRRQLEQDFQANNPTTGQQLNGAQKEQDDSNTHDLQDPAPANDQSNSDKRSDISGGDSFQTSILETQGPNHFSDYPMSDQGTGA